MNSWAEDYFESASGRVVTIHVDHAAADGTVLAHETERFAIRGRAYSDALPAEAPDYGDYLNFHRGELAAKETMFALDGMDANESLTDSTPASPAAPRQGHPPPHEMTAFARTSGDFNPIHTSHQRRRHLRTERPARARHVAVRHRPARGPGHRRQGRPL